MWLKKIITFVKFDVYGSQFGFFISFNRKLITIYFHKYLFEMRVFWGIKIKKLVLYLILLVFCLSYLAMMIFLCWD